MAIYEVEDRYGGHLGYWRLKMLAVAARPRGGTIRIYEDESEFPFGRCQDDTTPH